MPCLRRLGFSGLGGVGADERPLVQARSHRVSGGGLAGFPASETHISSCMRQV